MAVTPEQSQATETPATEQPKVETQDDVKYDMAIGQDEPVFADPEVTDADFEEETPVDDQPTPPVDEAKDTPSEQLPESITETQSSTDAPVVETPVLETPQEQSAPSEGTDLFTVKDGEQEEQVTLERLKQLASGGLHFTQQQQTLAEERKAFEAVKQQQAVDIADYRRYRQAVETNPQRVIEHIQTTFMPGQTVTAPAPQPSPLDSIDDELTREQLAPVFAMYDKKIQDLTVSVEGQKAAQEQRANNELAAKFMAVNKETGDNAAVGNEFVNYFQAVRGLAAVQNDVPKAFKMFKQANETAEERQLVIDQAVAAKQAEMLKTAAPKVVPPVEIPNSQIPVNIKPKKLEARGMPGEDIFEADVMAIIEEEHNRTIGQATG